MTTSFNCYAYRLVDPCGCIHHNKILPATPYLGYNYFVIDNISPSVEKVFEIVFQTVAILGDVLLLVNPQWTMQVKAWRNQKKYQPCFT